MDWQEALEMKVAATGHHRYRVLCRDDHPDHRAWRTEMIRQAGGIPEPPSLPPSLARQAGSLAKTMGQFAASGFAVADEVERSRRLKICDECEFLKRDNMQCLKCGCRVNLKTRLAVAHCPIDKW